MAKKVIAVIVGVALLIGLAVGGYAWYRNQRHNIGAGVTTVGNPPRQLSATKAGIPPEVFKGTHAVTSLFKIGPSGPLGKDVTFELPMSTPAAASEHLLVATAPDSGKPWSLVDPSTVKIMTDRTGKQRLRFTVNHLSQFFGLQVDVSAFLGEIKKNFVDALSSDLTAEAERPKCDNEADAKNDGIEVTTSDKKAIFWCAGKRSSGQLYLKIVNTRRYALTVKVSDPKAIKLTERPSVNWMNAADFGRLMPDLTILPRDGFTFDLNVKPGKSVRLQTALAQTPTQLFQAQVAMEILLSMTTKFGFGTGNPKDWKDKLATIAGSAHCIRSSEELLRGESDIGHLLVSCLDPKTLWETFGVAGALLSPIVFTGQVLSFFRDQIEGFIDSFGQQDTFTLDIKRMDGTTLRFKNLVIRLPEGWKVQRNIDKHNPEPIGLVPPGSHCVVRDYWSTGCPHIRVLGAKDIYDMGGTTNPFSEEKGGYFPAGGLMQCPGSSDWILSSPADSHPRQIIKTMDGKSVYGWDYRIKCGATMPTGPGGTATSSFQQAEVLFPRSEVLFVARDLSFPLGTLIARTTIN